MSQTKYYLSDLPPKTTIIRRHHPLNGQKLELLSVGKTTVVVRLRDGSSMKILRRWGVIATYLIRQAGITHKVAHTGAVTLIQRFGSALNLNIHFHMLFLDGVYADGANVSTRFRWVRAPGGAELTKPAHWIANRVGRFLERHGLLERDAENGYLATDAVNEDPINTLLGHSIT